MPLCLFQQIVEEKICKKSVITTVNFCCKYAYEIKVILLMDFNQEAGSWYFKGIENVTQINQQSHSESSKSSCSKQAFCCSFPAIVEITSILAPI